MKVLGGYLGTDVVVPLVYRSLESGKFDNSSFGLGDIFAEATLSWHLKQFDFCIGAGEWMPTGESAPKPTTRAGLGFWTTMFTLGGTWFVDSNRTWSVSALNRYEVNNTDQPGTDTTTGDAWTIEWGLGKAFNKTISAGVVGYSRAKTRPGTALRLRVLIGQPRPGPHGFPRSHQAPLANRFELECEIECAERRVSKVFVALIYWISSLAFSTCPPRLVLL